MRSQILIRSYLESIKQLTNAQSACLFVPANSQHGIEEQVISVGSGKFSAFANHQEYIKQIDIDEQIPRACGCAVIKGQTDRSVLVALTQQSDPSIIPDSSRRSPVKTEQLGECSWLCLQFDETAPNWLMLNQDTDTGSEQDIQLCQLFRNLIDLGAMQIGQIEQNNAMSNDPLTGLACRTRFQSEIGILFSQYSQVAVLMIHSGDFHHINKKFGHESGDKVIWEIAQNLQSSTRESDLISRFGGALFAVAVPVNEEQEAVTLAQKIQRNLQKPEYLNGAISLGFDVGIGCVDLDESFDNPSLRITGVINKADQALKASQASTQPTISLWQIEQMDVYDQRIDYIGGIFTADTATDYRNMLLLWDISNIIASNNQFDELLLQVIQRLGQTFDFRYAGIIENPHEDNLLRKTFLLDEDAQAKSISDMPLEVESVITEVVQRVGQQSKPQSSEQAGLSLFASPMSDGGKSCFFLISDTQGLSITTDSQMLFAALSKQLGKALNRTRLEEQLNQQLKQQKQQLQHELEQLKHDLQSSSMFYCSAAMEQLMKQAKRAAMTDTTTLIIGESGTGKERLVNALHKMGSRKDKPLVVVDCGAIPETLIESELFGHVKGAFTGAQNTSKGKVYEADGGTIMLDEIGELPLQMQTKLLRFVQEKHYTPVGGTKSESVDVKIIAVTNRELEQEVVAGNFRQDLFYRLNVLTLRTPPLRERPEDISLLSKHFLKKFSQQFSHAEKRLSDEAINKMSQYHWPGNIRELENRLMQANLLCENEVIDWADLKIEFTPGPQPDITQAIVAQEVPVYDPTPAQPDGQLPQEIPYSTPITPTAPVAEIAHNTLSKAEFIRQLQGVLTQHIKGVLLDQDVMRFPIGVWLEEDLIYLTYSELDQNVKKAGLRLGVSHSTLRRRIDKIIQKKQQQEEWRPPGWSEVEKALTDIAAGRILLGADLMNMLKLMLLDVILKQSPNNMSTVSVLLGVSEPTLYKLKKQLALTGILKDTVSLAAH